MVDAIDFRNFIDNLFDTPAPDDFLKFSSLNNDNDGARVGGARVGPSRPRAP